MSEITLQNISYFHGKDTPYEIKALDDINSKIEHGKITGIIGHTGSGKSTLIQLFNGILKPYEGKVLLDGRDIWEKSKEAKKEARNICFRVGLVMQYPEYQLFEETIYKDIAYGPQNMKLSKEEIDERVKEAVEFVGLEKELLDKSPFDLSGGQKRRAAIAGIIAMRPDVLVLDEPAAGLDPRGKTSIFENIRNYREKSGNTVVIVSHSMEDMAKYCDRLIVLANGKIVLEGDSREIFSSAKKLEEVGLDIPQITKLMLLLKERGIDVDPAVYTVEEALEQIIKLYKDIG